MSDITIKREEIPGKLERKAQQFDDRPYTETLLLEAAAYIRDLERNLAEERETRIRFGKMLDERAKEVGELQRRIAELEGAQPEAETVTMWRYTLRHRRGTDSGSTNDYAEIEKLAAEISDLISITIEPVTRPKTRKVMFWCNPYASGYLSGYPTKDEADFKSEHRLGSRAIPVTIDVEDPADGK